MDTPVRQDLKILISGADGRYTVKDKDGKERVLSPLTMYDMMEFERRIGGTFLDEERKMRLVDVLFLLYLSMRKDGLSQEDAAAGKYKLTEKQVYDMFDLRYLNKSGELFRDILKASGMDLPPEPSSEKGKNPGSPNPA